MIVKSRWTVVITWWSSGIGAWFAQAFAAKWYDLLLISRNQQELDDFAKTLKSRWNISTLAVDLSQKDELIRAEIELSKISNLEILINCAGFGIHKDFIDVENQQWEDMIMVNSIAAIRLCHQAIPIMKNNGHGIIINASSLGAFFVVWDKPIYAASKAFLHSFSQNIYRMYKKDNIYVQSLCPGPTETTFAKKAWYALNVKKMTVDEVVNASLHCIDHHKPVCIPWCRNKLILRSYRIFPRNRLNKILQIAHY